MNPCFPPVLYENLAVLPDTDTTGSTVHAVNSLAEATKKIGFIYSMQQIFIRGHKNAVALAKVLNVKTPLKNMHENGKINEENTFIQIKFEEVPLEPVQSLETVFSAYFFGNVAVELQAAMNRHHLQPGDLVALCNPNLSKLTSVRVQIKFPKQQKTNVVILRCKPFSSDIQISELTSIRNAQSCLAESECSKSFVQAKVGNKHPNFQVVNLGPVSNQRDIFEKLQSLKEYGIFSAIGNIKFLADHVNDRVVLSYFLDGVPKLDDRVFLFFREIICEKDYCEYDKFFKAVLVDNFADHFHFCLEKNIVTCGDVVAFVNPEVLVNPSFTSDKLLIEEPYVVEIKPQKNQTIIIIVKFYNYYKSLPENERVTIKQKPVTDIFVSPKMSISAEKTNPTKVKERAKPVKGGTSRYKGESKLKVTSKSIQYPDNNIDTVINNKKDIFGKNIEDIITHVQKPNQGTTKEGLIKFKTEISKERSKICELQRPGTSKNKSTEKFCEKTNCIADAETKEQEISKGGSKQCREKTVKKQQVLNGLFKGTRTNETLSGSKNASKSNLLLNGFLPENNQTEKHLLCMKKKIKTRDSKIKPVTIKKHVPLVSEDSSLSSEDNETSKHLTLLINSTSEITCKCTFCTNFIKASKKKTWVTLADLQEIDRMNEKKIGLTQKPKGLSFLPLSIIRPVTDNDFNYVSGFCMKCKSVTVYTDIKWISARPTCTKCQNLLQLKFCLELSALQRNEDLVEPTAILLLGKSVETYIHAPLKEFLKCKNCRKESLNLLREKLTYNRNHWKERAFDLKESEVVCVTRVGS